MIMSALTSLATGNERQALHTRALVFHGFSRKDGLFDIEGHLVDSKPFPFNGAFARSRAAHEPIHDMRVTLTLDRDFVVREATGSVNSHPYAACARAALSLDAMLGARIAPGWRKEVHRRLAGTSSCTHIRELLVSLGTAAFQSLIFEIRGENGTADGSHLETLVDSCVAFARNGPVALKRWPHLAKDAAKERDLTGDHSEK